MDFIPRREMRTEPDPRERRELGETMAESLSVAPMNLLLSPCTPQALVNTSRWTDLTANQESVSQPVCAQ